jgi:hypothetical protein
VRPRRRITRQSRWRDFRDFNELRIFMAETPVFQIECWKMKAVN